MATENFNQRLIIRSEKQVLLANYLIARTRFSDSCQNVLAEILGCESFLVNSCYKNLLIDLRRVQGFKDWPVNNDEIFLDTDILIHDLPKWQSKIPELIRQVYLRDLVGQVVTSGKLHQKCRDFLGYLPIELAFPAYRKNNND